MIPEGLHDRGAHFEDFGHVLTSNHHVPVVELHVHLGVFVEQIVSSSCWGQTDELPVITAQLMASRSLAEKRTWGKKFAACPFVPPQNTSEKAGGAPVPACPGAGGSVCHKLPHCSRWTTPAHCSTGTAETDEERHKVGKFLFLRCELLN